MSKKNNGTQKQKSGPYERKHYSLGVNTGHLPKFLAQFGTSFTHILKTHRVFNRLSYLYVRSNRLSLGVIRSTCQTLDSQADSLS